MTIGNLSIRFRHPTKDLDFFSACLELPCFRSWNVGSNRRTPTGETLEGRNSDSYWVSRVEYPIQTGFKKQLEYIIGLLAKQKDTLSEHKASGGKIEVYLQLSGAINNGDEIDSALLKTMGELGVDLLIEVFVEG